MRSVVLFATNEPSHFARLRPLIAAIAGQGTEIHVVTDRCFEADVVEAGAGFVDLYAGRPPIVPGDDSHPVSIKAVAFAAAHVDALAEEVKPLDPGVIVYDTFAVIGRAVAAALRLPYVNVCCGHNIDPAVFVPQLEANPRFVVSELCLQSVQELTERLGIDDASPYMYMSAMSPYLNVYGEPPEYLSEAERRVFEPIAFFGSLPSAERIATLEQRDRKRSAASRELYVSFGTVVWRHFLPSAVTALTAIAKAVEGRRDVHALITLGGADEVSELVGDLTGANVAVTPYTDQWKALGQSAAFITHHGMKSTHEAVFNEVPMISYPFFWDQPSLAGKCQALGTAVPLADEPQASISPDDVDAALDAYLASEDTMRDRLREARAWELDVIAQRPAVARRIIELA